MAHERMAGDGSLNLATRWGHLAALREEAVRSVRRRISRPDQAEDLVHEAMLRLAARPVIDLANPRAGALLVRVACALAIDQARWMRRQVVLAQRLGEGGVESPEDIVAERSQAAWLAAAVPALGEMERAALRHAADGNDVAEIATLIGVGYKAAENALGRARRKLRLRAAMVAGSIAALLRRVSGQPESGAALAAAPAVAVVLLFQSGFSPEVRAEASNASIAAMAQPATMRAHPIDRSADLVEPAPVTRPASRHTATASQAATTLTVAAAPSPPPPTPLVGPLVENKQGGNRTYGSGGRGFYVSDVPGEWTTQTACATPATCMVAGIVLSPGGPTNDPALK